MSNRLAGGIHTGLLELHDSEVLGVIDPKFDGPKVKGFRVCGNPEHGRYELILVASSDEVKKMREWWDGMNTIGIGATR